MRAFEEFVKGSFHHYREPLLARAQGGYNSHMSDWEPTEDAVEPATSSSALTEASDTQAKSQSAGDYWTETAFREGGKEQAEERKQASEREFGEEKSAGRLKAASRPGTAAPVVDDWEAETFHENRKPTTRSTHPVSMYAQTAPKPAMARDAVQRMQQAPRREYGYEQSREQPYTRMPSYPAPRDQYQPSSFQAAPHQFRSQYPGPSVPSYRASEAPADYWSNASIPETRQIPRRDNHVNSDFDPQGQDWNAYRGNPRPSQSSQQDTFNRPAEPWGVPVFKPNSYKEQSQWKQPETAGGRDWDMPVRAQSGRGDFPCSVENSGNPAGYYRAQGDFRPPIRPSEGQTFKQSYPRGAPYQPDNGQTQVQRGDFRTDNSLNDDYIKNPHSEKDFFTEDIPIDPNMLSQDSHFRSDRSWASFDFPAPLLTAVKQSGYEFPSKIQEMGFDLLMTGQYEHVVVQAPTGSGKTLTFVLPTLALMDAKCVQPQVVVVAPTLELLTQLTAEYTKYAQTLGISVGCVRRGCEISQVMLMTPRQCAFLLQARPTDFSSLKFAIFDEADHLLDKDDQMEFAMNAGIVVKQVPSTCHVLCFSATYSDSVRAELDKLLGEFSEIMVKKEDLVLENIKMYYVKRGLRETKLDLLERILDRKVPGVTLIFVNTVRFAQVLSGVLTRRGLKCALLVGRNITVDERFLTVQDFKRGFYEVVVSTNLLARGIDNTHITRVINFDIPNHWTTRLVDTETYLHRIGRAGRFARTGEAITMVACEAELKMVEEVMRHYGCVIEQLPMGREQQ